MRDRNITIAVVLLLAFAASAVYDDSAGTGQAFLQGNQKCAQPFGAYTMEKVMDGSIPSKVEIKSSNYKRKDGSCTREDIIKYNQLMKVPRVTNWETYNDHKDISIGNELIVVDAVNMFNHKTGNEVLDTFIGLTGEANADVTHYVAMQETSERVVIYVIKDVKLSKQMKNSVRGIPAPIGAESMLPEGIMFTMNPFYIAGDMNENGVARFTFLRNPSTGNGITGGAITGMQTAIPSRQVETEEACGVSTGTGNVKSITCSKTVPVGVGNCNRDADCKDNFELGCVGITCDIVPKGTNNFCTMDSECAGPGTDGEANKSDAPDKGKGYDMDDFYRGFTYAGDAELNWDSFKGNTDCYFQIGSSGFNSGAVGFVGFRANTNIWSGELFTFNLGATAGVRNFDLGTEFEENYDTKVSDPDNAGNNIWGTRTVFGPGNGWEAAVSIGPNINIPFDTSFLGQMSLDFSAEALWCETGTGFITGLQLNKAMTDTTSVFIGALSGSVDEMDMGNTAVIGFSGRW